MKIIIDDNIPYIKEAAEKIAEEVIYAPGKDFTRELIQDADALIIRTRTHCNRELLEGSKVKFIATATIGFDHIDTEYCKQAGIEWANAPGCNSASVAQYIQSSLLIWKSLRNKKPDELTIGIIGVGNVGSKVAKVAQDFGMRVLLNDLPREEKEGNIAFTSLEKIAEECDIITFHVPLYKEGKYKTSGRREFLPVSPTKACCHQHFKRRSDRNKRPAGSHQQRYNLGRNNRRMGT